MEGCGRDAGRIRRPSHEGGQRQRPQFESRLGIQAGGLCLRPSISQGWTRGWGLEAVTDLREEPPRGGKLPGQAQSRAQKNFFSRKGFSEVGTGVMRGSSQA